jgi:hypothetical protein
VSRLCDTAPKEGVGKADAVFRAEGNIYTKCGLSRSPRAEHVYNGIPQELGISVVPLNKIPEGEQGENNSRLCLSWLTDNRANNKPKKRYRKARKGASGKALQKSESFILPMRPGNQRPRDSEEGRNDQAKETEGGKDV